MGAIARRNTHRQIQFLPGLHLAGRWMERAGFQIGQTVTVTVTNGVITIQP